MLLLVAPLALSAADAGGRSAVIGHRNGAIAVANGTPYGLVTGVWTRDLSRALTVATAVKSGQVRINSYSVEGSIGLPFGGYKRSGFGREQGVEALANYTQVKNVMINFG